jgi:hypothetical protein
MFEKLKGLKLSQLLMAFFVVMIGWNILLYLYRSLMSIIGGTEGSVLYSVSWPALFLALIVFLVLLKGWSDKRGEKSPGAQFAYQSLVGFLFVSAFLYAFLGERWLVNPSLDVRSDIRTGVPTYMVYEVEAGVYEPGFENWFFFFRKLLHPDDCRPMPALHKEFDYEKQGTCLSPLDNTKRMRPVRPDDNVIRPSAKSFLATVWGLFSGDDATTNASEADAEEAEVVSSSGGTQCPQRIRVEHLRPGGDYEFCMEAGRSYKTGKPYRIFFDGGMWGRARIECDSAPVRVHQRRFDTFPEDCGELFTRFNPGEYAGSTTNAIMLRTNRQTYEQYHLRGLPIYFRIVVE